MDIVSALRDAFMGDEDQTPHFVAQLNGKEQFIDDAKKLDALRKPLEAAREATAPRPISPAPIAIAPPSLLERLQAAEAKVVTPKIMATLVGKFFDDLNARIFSDLLSFSILRGLSIRISKSRPLSSSLYAFSQKRSGPTIL